MAKEKQSLADQIHAALRIANDGSTTVAEAETAMLTAQRLAAKHFGGMENVPSETGTGESDVLFLHLEGGLVVNHWRSRLLAIVSENFRCRMLEYNIFTLSQFTKKPITKKQLCIVGHSEDAKIAFRVYIYAITVAEAELLHYLLAHTDTLGDKLAERKAAGESWSEGFVSGVKMKFAAQVKRNPSVGLMLIVPSDVDKAIDDAQPDNLKMEHDQPQANAHFFEGYITGKNIGDGNLEVGS